MSIRDRREGDYPKMGDSEAVHASERLPQGMGLQGTGGSGQGYNAVIRSEGMGDSAGVGRPQAIPDRGDQESQEGEAGQAHGQLEGRASGALVMGEVTRDNVESVDYKRQIGLFDPERHADTRIIIAGLGNIGSHTALALARMGIKHFTLYDFDTIEAHNLSSQAYKVDDVGTVKTDALAGMMRALHHEIEIETVLAPFTGKEIEQAADFILISAVDSMEARREIAKNLPQGLMVIDGRMGGGQIEVWSQLSQEWGATLTRDGDDDPCGARYISYTSYIIAGLIANQVKRHLEKQKVAPRILMHVDTLELLKP